MPFDTRNGQNSRNLIIYNFIKIVGDFNLFGKGFLCEFCF
jgi:hypothetical protein